VSRISIVMQMLQYRRACWLQGGQAADDRASFIVHGHLHVLSCHPHTCPCKKNSSHRDSSFRCTLQLQGLYRKMQAHTGPRMQTPGGSAPPAKALPVRSPCRPGTSPAHNPGVGCVCAISAAQKQTTASREAGRNGPHGQQNRS
jgi:hypothetical protein